MIVRKLSMRMTAPLRKLALIVHIVSSVGWIGAAAAFLALAVVGLTSQDAQMTRATYPAMELIARFVIVPLAWASLLSGLIQGLGTVWGVFRYYWVLAKLSLTTFATIVLLQKTHLIGYAAERAAAIPLTSSDLHSAGAPLVVHAAGGIGVLLITTTLSVYKPWGMTPYGRRRQQGRQFSTSLEEVASNTVPNLGFESVSPANETTNKSLAGGLKILLGFGFALIVAIMLMHLAGHGSFHGH